MSKECDWTEHKGRQTKTRQLPFKGSACPVVLLYHLLLAWIPAVGNQAVGSNRALCKCLVLSQCLVKKQHDSSTSDACCLLDILYSTYCMYINGSVDHQEMTDFDV